MLFTSGRACSWQVYEHVGWTLSASQRTHCCLPTEPGQATMPELSLAQYARPWMQKSHYSRVKLASRCAEEATLRNSHL